MQIEVFISLEESHNYELCTFLKNIYCTKIYYVKYHACFTNQY